MKIFWTNAKNNFFVVVAFFAKHFCFAFWNLNVYAFCFEVES